VAELELPDDPDAKDRLVFRLPAYTPDLNPVETQRTS
jgi:transposase